MPNLPAREQQIRQSHAVLIHQVVKACHNPAEKLPLQQMLEMAQQQGWADLVRTIRLIVDGRRDEALLNGLDEEDTVIIRSILQGIQNPASLPDPNQGADPAMAAPGLAHMINAARRGDAQALKAAAFMAEQMTNTQGDMRLLGGQIKRLLDGERNPDVLCKGMGPSGQQLVLSLLEELNKLAEQ
ncbi:MAG: hypothetical protein ACWGOW_01215 [Gammaproteobacteria bacterium]